MTAQRPLLLLLPLFLLLNGSQHQMQEPPLQEGIQVLSATVESRFPKGILFRIEVAGPQEIREIILRFRLLGERTQRYDNLEFAPSSQVKAELLLRTDTADRYIPPGAELEYFFEVRDNTDQALVTETQRFLLLDPRFQWSSISGDAVSILYHGPMGARAQKVLDASQDTLQRMGALMGVTVEQPLRLTMYNSWPEMQEALPPRSQVQEQSLVVQGVLFGDLGVILVLGNVSRVAGVTSHEVVHFLVEQAMGELTRIVPVWLNEGLAEYGSDEPNSSYDRALRQAIAQDRLIPLTSLTAYPGEPDDLILMYGEGKSAVTYLVGTYGAQPLKALLKGLRQGQSIDRALKEAYGFDRVGLERLWRVSIGAPPPAAEQPLAARPTPLPLPNIVPFGALTPTPFPTRTPSPAVTATPTSTGGCSRAGGMIDGAPLLALSYAVAMAALRHR